MTKNYRWQYFIGLLSIVLTTQVWADSVDSDSVFRKQTQGYPIAGVICQWGEQIKSVATGIYGVIVLRRE